ncbi:hypothetical protein CTAYLR_002176 [Chrysophaeum taylorii]|uniref:Glycoside hydrolase family 5 domain-containing protein n=1 Tax=Chrysophaeum taylorii TaxID=2483200 RepID=A0AAD7UN64_9STRA|nr:hypothetical protein CTAYLR_002176 [Chrysophaeum taylorii]
MPPRSSTGLPPGGVRPYSVDSVATYDDALAEGPTFYYDDGTADAGPKYHYDDGGGGGSGPSYHYDDGRPGPKFYESRHSTSYIGQPIVQNPAAKVVSYKPPKKETCCHFVCGRQKKAITGAMPRRAKIAAGIGISILLGIIIIGFFRWEKVKKPRNSKSNRYHKFTGGPTRMPTYKPTIAPTTAFPTPRPTVETAPTTIPPTPATTVAPTIEAAPEGSIVAALGSLYVDGAEIMSTTTGAPAQVAGNSFFWSNTGYDAEAFYNRDVVLELKDDWNSQLVRAAMGVEEPGGYVDDPDGNEARVRTVVEAAIDFGLYVIIDWHSHEAEAYEALAIDFFRDMAASYGQYPNVIYEVYNEPISQDWASTIKPYAENVISAIRAVDPDNLVLVGSRQYSQRIDEAAADPILGYDNVAYAFHFYAATHADQIRAYVDDARTLGAAVFCSEWGTVEATGDGDPDFNSTTTWIDFMDSRSISHCNWAVNDKDEGASILVPGASTTGAWLYPDDLTESGRLVRSILTQN